MTGIGELRAFASAALLGVALIAVADAAGPTDWPGFRGHGAAGVADASRLPTTWSAKSNVLWTVEIPGRGWSSPIVWRDRVYVTSAINSGSFKQPSTGIYGNDLVAVLTKQGLPPAEVNARVLARDIELSSDVEDVRYMVYALEASTGKIAWEREAHKGKPAGGRHRKNTYASETPMTDGERIYASFGGNVGLFCYSMDGRLLWTHRSSPQPIYLDFGTAASPVVHRGRVYLLRDSEAESSLTALDAKTGQDIWKVDRTPLSEGSRMKSGWATPFIWETPTRTEIVTIGKSMVVSYSLDGKELWRLKGMTQATPTPVAGGGLLFVGSGSQGEANRPLYAIKPGASGDISSTDPLNPSIAWFQPRLSAYTGSPLFYRGRLYVVNDNGVMQVVNAATGVEVYKVRVGGTGNTFSSSPFASDGRIYVVTEDGDTIVFEAGDEYREVARNNLGEMSLASPAANDNSLFIRTQTKLFRVGTRPASR
jgi:outer membrane protein assembly factor BamB